MARIVHIDDDPGHRMLVAALVEPMAHSLGVEFRQFDDPVTARHELLGWCTSPDGPQLVLTDHVMPGLTGARLATELADRAGGLPLQTVILTSYLDDAEISAVKEADVCRVVDKVADLDALDARLSEVIQAWAAELGPRR